MRNVCWQRILMKYHSLVLSKIKKVVAIFVVCCSRDWLLKGLLEEESADDSSRE